MSGVEVATRYVLDTSAILTLHNDESGSDRVEGLREEKLPYKFS